MFLISRKSVFELRLIGKSSTSPTLQKDQQEWIVKGFKMVFTKTYNNFC